MKRLISVVVVFLATAGTASAVTISGGAGGWRQDPTGWVEYKKDGVITAKTHVDVEDDLHFSDRSRASGWFSIEGVPLLPDIRVQYTPMKFEGSGWVAESFTFGDITVNASDYVESKLEANQVDITLYYGLPFIERATAGKLSLNAGVNVKVIDGYVRVRDITRGIEESESATVPVPMVHLSGELRPIDLVGFEFFGNWIGYSGSRFYETIAEVKVYPVNRLFIGAGYKYQRLRIDDVSDISADLKVKGFFAEAGFLF